jgi:class 3 adenylate cyclase
VQAAVPPAEERKVVTVVFADLVGSTELAHVQDPERTRVVLDRFYDSMAVEIERVGGTVEKFVGDAVMAAFGAPAAYEDHAERALHAALAMRHRLSELFGDRLVLRIGVNSGEVVVGRAREGSSFVTGDTVNVGARLEQTAAPGEILVGERTVLLARGAFEFAELIVAEGKGKSGGIACRRLVRALSLMRPRGVGGLRRAFVGREQELDRLQEAYDAVADGGGPQLVTILGDAGVGKTRLVRELWEWLAARDSPPLRRAGRCMSYGQGITYWPLAEVLREHFGILESDSPQMVAERLGDRPFLGLTLGLAPPEELHPLVARERLHDSWAEFLDGLVAEGPAVVLIEDVHWAEDDLCELLDGLLAQVEGPLLLLATARPELLDRRPGWGGRHDGLRLGLEALPPLGAGRLLDELLGIELPVSLRGIIVERAEGNPLFLEELVSTLIDTRVLERQNGDWTVGALPPDFRVPDSVHAVLAARIDLLPADEKAALQAAAVIGRIFWTGPVYELVGGGRPDIGLLEERGFVRRRVGSSIAGEREYAIKHALTREVAYASLPKAKRAQLHAAFAAWLEESTERNDEHAALLAHHYLEAVRPDDADLAWPGSDERGAEFRERAVVWARRAAALAVGRYEIDESLALLHRALELEPERPQQAELWQEIGHANALKFDGPTFREAMEKAIELGGDPAELYTELALQAVRRSGMWIRRPDPALIDGWVERALELSPEGSPTYPWALAALTLRTSDESAARKLQAVAEQVGDPELRSHALAALTQVAWRAGNLEQARATIDERLEVLARISAPDDRHFALMQAVEVDLAQCRLSAAARESSQLADEVEGLTAHHRVHGVHMQLRVEVLAGRWDTVKSLSPAAERAVEANATTPCSANSTILLYCALASARHGDHAEALALQRQAEAWDAGKEADALKLWLAISRNSLEELRELVDRLVLAPLPFMPFEFDRSAALLDALVALGDRARIESIAPASMRPETYAEPFALRALGFARGDRSLLSQAAARFDEISLDWFADETRKALA